MDLNATEFDEKAMALIKDALKLLEPKRLDYAQTSDVLANFKRMAVACKALRIGELLQRGDAMGSSLYLLLLKIDRIINLNLGSGEANNESIEDSFADALNYLLLTYGLWREKQK
jgi:hypothetical protein